MHNQLKAEANTASIELSSRASQKNTEEINQHHSQSKSCYLTEIPYKNHSEINSITLLSQFLTNKT